MGRLSKKIKDLYINRHRIDTDRDGLSDHDEINIYHTNPYHSDTDKDGVSDGEEIRRGRNPLGPGTLKDLFIPYPGNDYQPQILLPRRLFFYAGAAIITKLVIAALVVLFPAGAWLTPDLMVQESKRVIELTNQIRQRQSIPALKESSLLTQAAFDKSQDMLIKQYFAHIGPDGLDLASWIKGKGYRYLVAGENLAMGFASADEVVTAWTKSRTHYANLIDTDYEEIGVGMTSGMYSGVDTTMVAQYFALASGPAVAVEESKPQVVEPVVPTPAPETVVIAVNQPQEVLPEKIEEPVVKPTPAPTPVPTPAPKPTPVVVVKPKPTPVTQPVSEPVVVAPTPISTLEPTPEVTPEATPTPEPEIAIKPTLANPKFIIYPTQDVSEQNEILFVAYAPTAERVMVLDNGNKIAEKTSLQSEFFDFTLRLEPGAHTLVVKSFKGDLEAVSEILELSINDTAPNVDLVNSQLVVSQPTGQTDKIVMAQIYLSSDATEAVITFDSHHIIKLTKSDEIKNGFNLWTGQLIIFDPDNEGVFDTVVMPVLSVKDTAGNESVQDIKWENIVPTIPSLTRQYLFMKSYPLKQVDLLFDISGWYYRLILVVAVVALLLNIFIEIKKQYPRLIVSTLGLISLMVIFIIV